MSWWKKIFGGGGASGSRGGTGPSESRPLKVRCIMSNCPMEVVCVIETPPAPHGVSGDFLDVLRDMGMKGYQACCQCKNCGSFVCYEHSDTDAPCRNCKATSWASGFYRAGAT
jgi:hypothetical protein